MSQPSRGDLGKVMLKGYSLETIFENKLFNKRERTNQEEYLPTTTN